MPQIKLPQSLESRKRIRRAEKKNTWCFKDTDNLKVHRQISLTHFISVDEKVIILGLISQLNEDMSTHAFIEGCYLALS